MRCQSTHDYFQRRRCGPRPSGVRSTGLTARSARIAARPRRSRGLRVRRIVRGSSSAIAAASSSRSRSAPSWSAPRSRCTNGCFAMHLLCSSKKGISAHQMHRMLGVSYKSAWFMSHRLREAMRDHVARRLGRLGQDRRGRRNLLWRQGRGDQAHEARQVGPRQQACRPRAWSSVVARFASFHIAYRERGQRLRHRALQSVARKPPDDRRGEALHQASVEEFTQPPVRVTTAPMSMFAATCIPTPSKATSPSSSAA